MMSEQRIDEIKREQKNLSKKQEELYYRQRETERLTEGIGTYFHQTQQLLQTIREVFRKNDDVHDFDEVYSFFSRDTSKVMETLGDEKRKHKQGQLFLEERNDTLTKEKQKLYKEGGSK